MTHQRNEMQPGIFASIDEGLGVSLKTAIELGVKFLHLHAPGKQARTAAAIEQLKQRLREHDAVITVVFAGFEGESYASIPAVRETIGLVPTATRAERIAELKNVIDYAKSLGASAVGLHIGCVPHDRTDRELIAVVQAAQDVCDYAAHRTMNIHVETGQEPIDVLREFLQAVDRHNLFVNFDPANMILYGCGEPIPALRAIGRYVRSIHCKDAVWSSEPGISWGTETPFGEGDVDAAGFRRTLCEIGYQGPLVIEREIPQDPGRQKRDIAKALDQLTRLIEDISSDDEAVA